MMNNKEFYDVCAEILDTVALGEAFPYRKRTRWNNRSAGQGRFLNRGIIRCFGNTVHVALNNPPVHRIFNSQDECLEFLKELK